ncbi:putative O-glycosylation ligase, exosortase A system-associated [Rubrivivax gelatinosus]|uniref:putative O-glycosylation ligase, exosortase A system-associated n=1 Tax=Rubrivivax gelatinosus TaxID=28068 RepID=UPI00030BDA2B|nr:putative O-glycosylation ligase, exosortase A system-associated [Rubrivivax gelatinosus]MBG6080387.1 putative O-glycosylation ligase (exosortase A-associated) [Rubrivivax gelatinosus]
MRDLLILAIVCAGALASLRRPWIGILLWVWISIMNPHRYAYGFAYSAPVAQIVAIGVLLGMLFNARERESPFKGPPVVWLVLFMAWMTISWLLGMDREGDFAQWDKVMKIMLMTLVGLTLLRTKLHIFAFTWATTVSMGLLAIKGGVFTLAMGGNYRVWGPPGSQIQDNNEFALACVMTIPLIRFLQLQPGWRRHLMSLWMILCAVAALGSHSRGSFLALVAMGVVLWWRGNKRVMNGIALIAIAAMLVAFMPEQWADRMSSISQYQEDESAQGRISAWWTAWGVATHHVFGAGFNVARPDLFALYSPIFEASGVTHAAHSIYFQVLGNHGFVGLFLFLMIWATTWATASWLRKNGRLQPESRWAADLGGMIQVALVAYLVGGAFLSLSYFDLPYNIMAIAVLAKVWVLRKRWQTDPALPKPARFIPGVGTVPIARPAGGGR